MTKTARQMLIETRAAMARARVLRDGLLKKSHLHDDLLIVRAGAREAAEMAFRYLQRTNINSPRFQLLAQLEKEAKEIWATADGLLDGHRRQPQLRAGGETRGNHR